MHRIFNMAASAKSAVGGVVNSNVHGSGMGAAALRFVLRSCLVGSFVKVILMYMQAGSV